MLSVFSCTYRLFVDLFIFGDESNSFVYCNLSIIELLEFLCILPHQILFASIFSHPVGHLHFLDGIVSSAKVLDFDGLLSLSFFLLLQNIGF